MVLLAEVLAKTDIRCFKAFVRLQSMNICYNRHQLKKKNWFNVFAIALSSAVVKSPNWKLLKLGNWIFDIALLFCFWCPSLSAWANTKA